MEWRRKNQNITPTRSREAEGSETIPSKIIIFKSISLLDLTPLMRYWRFSYYLAKGSKIVIYLVDEMREAFDEEKRRGKKCLRAAFAIIWDDYENYFFSVQIPQRNRKRNRIKQSLFALQPLFQTHILKVDFSMIDMIEFDLVSTIFWYLIS